jgi:hypothetical protein
MPLPNAAEQRQRKRYQLTLPMSYWTSTARSEPVTGFAMLRDVSPAGLSFHSRTPLKIGAHLNMVIDWPVKCEDLCPVKLHLTGFVLRCAAGITAVSITSHRFEVVPADVPESECVWEHQGC